MTDWQAKALSEDRLSLLIEPLKSQPSEVLEMPGFLQFGHYRVDRHLLAIDARNTIPLPHAVGDRLIIERAGECFPLVNRFTLEVTAVTVKRLQDVTLGQLPASGLVGMGEYEGGFAPRKVFSERWPHQPPHAWADNPWSTFSEVKQV